MRNVDLFAKGYEYRDSRLLNSLKGDVVAIDVLWRRDCSRDPLAMKVLGNGSDTGFDRVGLREAGRSRRGRGFTPVIEHLGDVKNLGGTKLACKP